MFSLRKYRHRFWCVSSDCASLHIQSSPPQSTIQLRQSAVLSYPTSPCSRIPKIKKVVSCLRTIDASYYGVSSWANQWNDAYGDGIHKDECIYTREPTPQYYSIQVSREPSGMYHARVLQGDTILKAVDVPTCPKHIQAPPTMGQFIWYLEKAYENVVPPYSC